MVKSDRKDQEEQRKGATQEAIPGRVSVDQEGKLRLRKEEKGMYSR